MGRKGHSAIQTRQQEVLNKKEGTKAPIPLLADQTGVVADNSIDKALMMCSRTVSIAVPGSVIENTQTWEQAALVAGQVARAATVFNVHEVVVFDDSGFDDEGTITHGAAFLARVCQYLETPQYLRRRLIPMHKDLRLAGALPPVDAPHHMRADEWKRYREGVVISVTEEGCVVDIGLTKSAFVNEIISENSRVTLHVGKRPKTIKVEGEEFFRGKIVTHDTPLIKHSMYWGYTTRLAKQIPTVFSECPFPEGYDLIIGTSEHGTEVQTTLPSNPTFKHALVVFGGPKGLEHCFKLEPTLNGRVPSSFFKYYVNTCPEQGSRTIRSEEAIWISLSALQGHFRQRVGETSLADMIQ